ncbi:glycosyltransferase family 4 protein [Candidatus Peregrinibacteria bacterium]|nr:glycosyltransferase family 4 protein [Candidatus Peregrinibacteria bacterium]
MMHTDSSNRPRILLLIDIPGWAFHTVAKEIERHLSDRFAFTIMIKDNFPTIDEDCFDLIHVFYEFEEYHKQFLTGKAKVIRSVYSHYWEIDHHLTPMQLYQRYLHDAHAVIVPSMRLFHAFEGIPPPVYLFPEGVDTALFSPGKARIGPLVVGWAGKDIPIKRLDILRAACEGICALKIADGSLSQDAMQNFYRGIDVIACTSIAEGCPRPLIEAMACGAYPVSFDVGVVPEVVIDGMNGMIVKQQSTGAFREALQWCRDHCDTIRGTRRLNAERIRATRTWQNVTAHLADIYYAVL